MEFTYPKNIRFDCTYCGICCGDTKDKKRHILMLNDEAIEISIEINKKISDFASTCSGKKPYFYEMNKKENGKCVFLSSENKCNIYLKRPLICTFYPFELINQSNGSHEFRFTNECPGINKGNPLDKKYFIELFELAKKRFNLFHKFKK